MADATMPSSAFTGVIIGLVSSFGSVILIALVVFIFWASGCAGSGRILLDRLGRPGEFDDEQAFAREEAEALENMDDMSRSEYLRAKAFVTANPPESLPTDISLSQYLAIQEKGISAWEFEPELEVANCFVEARTEIEFFDSESTVMSNLPVPKQNDVYYWEAKIYEKPENTLLGIGMATKPYPLFRLPGYHKFSVAYHSNGSRHYNQPFSRTAYGPQLVQGDVVGVGYRPRTGSIFFTRNGKRLDEVVHGLKSQNFFPAVGANGPAVVHVNLGQSGFVFIEANVKKWGLAPVTGSLAPPPPYGSEQGSILLETGTKDGDGSCQPRPHRQSLSGASRYSVQAAGAHVAAQRRRSRSGTLRGLPPTSPGPLRSSTDISLAQLVPNEEEGEGAAGEEADATSAGEDALQLHLEDATNPPPDYAAAPRPPESEVGPMRISDGEAERGLGVQRMYRHPGDGSATLLSLARANSHERQPPVPSYSDAVREGSRAVGSVRGPGSRGDDAVEEDAGRGPSV